MTPSRNQMLEEMGLTPQWKLRERPQAARAVQKTGARADLPSPARGAVADGPGSGDPRSVNIEAVQKPAVVNISFEVAQAGWDELRQSIAECRSCELCKDRQLVVPGVGDEQADWLFIGEGPGAEEDEQGLPFVGPAGRLLDAMLAAIDLQRGNDVYITNVVKCRPPGNRTPKEAEIAACVPYLKRQIALLQPKLIVLLGKVAVHGVLGEDASIGSLRGKIASYHDGERSIPVVVTYHPAYLLRTLPDKAQAWEDLCLARRVMRRSGQSE